MPETSGTSPISSISSLEELHATFARFDMQSIMWQFKKLGAIREWALSRIGIDYTIGDRVVICSDFADRLTPGSGWYAKRECLAKGALATVREIDFNTYGNGWQTTVILDREWSVSDWANETHRYWRGPVATMPAGFTAPSAYDQDKYPDGKKHSFALNSEHLRLATTFEVDHA